MLKCSGKYLPALDSVNQAIELAGDNKPRDYFQAMILLKIELQIKLQLFNEAHQALLSFRESMTDSEHANEQVGYYERILADHAPNLSQPQVKSPSDLEPENSDFLALEEGCCIEQSAHKGRFMWATNTIPYGMYLVKERVLVCAYYEEYLQSRCNNCHQSLAQVFYPCRRCTQVLFCTPKCEDRAWTMGMHRFDCGLIDLLQDNCLAWNAFQLLSTIGLKNAMLFYQSSTDEVVSIEQFSKAQRSSREPFETMGKVEQLRTFAVIDSFVDHREVIDPVADREYLRWALKILLIINQEQHYFDAMPTNCSLLNDFVLLTQRVVMLMRKLRYNSFGWTEMDGRDLNKNHLIANCVALVSSFINHSCDSNCFWEICDGVIAVSAISPISAGQEVNISYGPSSFDPLHRRQKRLHRYSFVCSCSSCERDLKLQLSLCCINCLGPVYEPPNDKLQPSCIHCCEPSIEHSSRAREVSKINLHLAFNERFSDGEPSRVFPLAQQLMALVYRQSAPLAECVLAACVKLADSGHLQEAIQIVTEYLIKLNLQELWNADDLLKGAFLFVKFVRLTSAQPSELKPSDRAFSDIASVLVKCTQALWKDLHEASKSNQSLNLIIELVENSLSAH